eukprot:6625575-Alexandrium_andersonii.AAC.1
MRLPSSLRMLACEKQLAGDISTSTAAQRVLQQQQRQRQRQQRQQHRYGSSKAQAPDQLNPQRRAEIRVS